VACVPVGTPNYHVVEVLDKETKCELGISSKVEKSMYRADNGETG